MSWVAQVLTPVSIHGGKQLLAYETMRQGHLVKLESDGSRASLGGVNQRILGICFGLNYRAYAPTTEQFAAGDPITVVWGDGEALLSADLFDGGSLPSVGDGLYAGATGLWKNSGSATERLGTVVKIVTQSGLAGVNATQNLAHVRFTIKP